MLTRDNPYILLPVKRLEKSKTRLSHILNTDERAKLTLLMLKDVMENVSEFPNAFVVTGDDAVVGFAEEHGLKVIGSLFGELNADLRYARSRCLAAGAVSIIFLLPDLPALTAGDLSKMVELEEVAPSAVIAPSRDGGTNALLLKPCDLIEPGFGQGSFDRHLKNLSRMKVELRIYSSIGTRLDIDTADDVRELLEIKGQLSGERKALKYLREIMASKSYGGAIDVSEGSATE